MACGASTLARPGSTRLPPPPPAYTGMCFGRVAWFDLPRMRVRAPGLRALRGRQKLRVATRCYRRRCWIYTTQVRALASARRAAFDLSSRLCCPALRLRQKFPAAQSTARTTASQEPCPALFGTWTPRELAATAYFTRGRNQNVHNKRSSHLHFRRSTMHF